MRNAVTHRYVAVVDEMIGLKGYNPKVRTGAYAVAASRARYMTERNDWKGAADLQLVDQDRFDE